MVNPLISYHSLIKYSSFTPPQNINVHIQFAYRTHPTLIMEKRVIFKNTIHIPSPFKDDENQRFGKNIEKGKGIATKMSSIMSFFSSSHFKDRIWRIYSSESLKHSWDVLKSMLQARQTELESHYHQDSMICPSNVKMEANEMTMAWSISKLTLLRFICVSPPLTPHFLLNTLSHKCL